MGLFDNVMSIGESATGTLGAIPGVGEAMSAGNALYHTGAAVYDGATGDRDGAINHGAQAIYGGIGAIPAVSEAIGTVDAVASGVGTYGRVGMAAAGGDSSQVPGGISDAIGSGAVLAANAYLGADDSNWFAEGDQPTGTRGGEIAAGSALLGAGALSMFGPLGMLAGGIMGHEAGPAIGEALGANLDGPTSGARGPNGAPNGWAQAGGDWLHERPETRDALAGLLTGVPTPAGIAALGEAGQAAGGYMADSEPGRRITAGLPGSGVGRPLTADLPSLPPIGPGVGGLGRPLMPQLPQLPQLPPIGPGVGGLGSPLMPQLPQLPQLPAIGPGVGGLGRPFMAQGGALDSIGSGIAGAVGGAAGAVGNAASAVGNAAMNPMGALSSMGRGLRGLFGNSSPD